MDSMTDEILSQLGGAPMQRMAQHTGIDQTQLAGAVAAALPLLLGALGRNADRPGGAEALYGALGRDHAGVAGTGLGDVLGAVLGGAPSRQTDGPGQLSHIFGGRQPQAVGGLGQVTGLGNDKSRMLLQILAPIVMAYLAKRMFGGGATNAGALGDILGQERRQAEHQAGPAGGLLAGVLDQDGDGDLDLNDMIKAGMGMIGRGS